MALEPFQVLYEADLPAYKLPADLHHVYGRLGFATAVLFSSAFPGMFGGFVRRKFQRTYDALLAAPVDVEELVTAEVSAISLKAGLYGVAPLLVAITEPTVSTRSGVIARSASSW